MRAEALLRSGPLAMSWAPGAAQYYGTALQKGERWGMGRHSGHAWVYTSSSRLHMEHTHHEGYSEGALGSVL